MKTVDGLGLEMGWGIDGVRCRIRLLRLGFRLRWPFGFPGIVSQVFGLRE